MIDLRELDKYRVDGYTHEDRKFHGVFCITSKSARRVMRIIASNGDGWDHVSISLNNRCPNWQEMEQIKRLFFKEEELCWQYHVPPADHINVHPYVLHIWRKHNFDMPLPPKEMV